MSEDERPEEQPGYWEQQAASQAAQTPYAAPEPTLQLNPQSAYPAGQQPPYPGQPGQQPPYAGQQPYPGQPYGYPAQPYPPQPYAQQPYGYHRPDHPKATTALVLGLIGLLGGLTIGLPLLAAPFAWVIGHRARKEIRASGGYYGGESNATAGMVLGIVGTILLILAVLAVIGLIVVFAIIAGTDASTSSV